jgi:lysophospholipase L1-like esterase
MQKLLFLLLMVWTHSAMSQSALRIGSDTVKVAKAELVIQNSTKGIAGYLYNTDNGKTAFKKLGKSIQFKVGTLNFPKAGDTMYVNQDFAGQTIKVWRNGLLQYRDNEEGVRIDNTYGHIYFKPALNANDKIYIEAFSGVDFSLDGIYPDQGVTQQVGKLTANAFDNGDNTFTLRWATNSKTLYLSPKVYGIGSSTLFGYGVMSPYKLGDRVSNWLKDNTNNSSWTNLAVFGYTSDDLSATADGGVASNNIDTAVNANPDFIFASLGSNDASKGFTVEKSIANYKKMDSIARSKGIPVFWATTQPRTGLNAAQQTLLKRLADSIRTVFPDRYVEAFNDVVDKNATTDAVILPQYAIGDGVHLNADGLAFIANSLFERMLGYFRPIKGVKRYVIDSSNNQINWAQFDVVTDQNIVKKTYTRVGKRELYFRIRPEFIDDTYAEFSNVAKLKEIVTPPAPMIFDHRVLVDLGGDGVKTLNSANGADGKPTPSPDSQGKQWNNWFGDGTIAGFTDGSAIDDLKSAQGTPTGLSMQLIGLPQGTFGTSETKSMNFNGHTVGVNDYPMEAIYDNVFFHSSINPNGVTMRIRGLTKTNTYYIKLWGGRVDPAPTPPVRVLEAKLGRDAWTASQKVDTRYLPTEAPDYNKAIKFEGITGLDSVDINIKVAAGSTLAHISLMDIGIMGTLPTLPSVILRDTTTTLSTIQLPSTVLTYGATISTYEWKQLSGPNNAIIGNEFESKANISGLTNGKFVFKLTVTTTNRKSYSAEVKVDVFPNNNGKKTMFVNFSNTPVQAIPGWLNVSGPVAGQRITVTDNVTNWTVDNVSSTTAYWSPFAGSSGSNTDGASTGNNSGIIPDIVLKSFWYNYSIRYAAGKENLELSGLNPAKTYTLKLYASRSGVPADVKFGCWRVNGGAELLQNAVNNTTLETVVINVVPDASGKIRIAVVAPTSSTNGTFSFMNALILQEN